MSKSATAQDMVDEVINEVMFDIAEAGALGRLDQQTLGIIKVVAKDAAARGIVAGASATRSIVQELLEEWS